MVSIVMVTYNHEKYIRQALDSILMQKVNFKYEVLIGEDASPDNTAEILYEYEDKYPDIIKVWHREKNLGMLENGKDMIRRATGKYYASLEGDDYWISTDKLQKQVDFLESHPDYSAVYSLPLVVDKNGDEIIEGRKWFDSGDYVPQGAGFKMPAQTASMLCRWTGRYKEMLLGVTDVVPSDVAWVFVFAGLGKIWVDPEKMAAYRKVEDEGTSYSAKVAQEGISITELLPGTYAILKFLMEHDFPKNVQMEMSRFYVTEIGLAHSMTHELTIGQMLKKIAGAPFIAQLVLKEVATRRSRKKIQLAR
jgi:glycosyltransferase involved in cell wall biosynthesis